MEEVSYAGIFTMIVCLGFIGIGIFLDELGLILIGGGMTLPLIFITNEIEKYIRYKLEANKK